MPFYYNTESEPIIDVSKVYETKEIIKRLKKRFASYGYDEIQTAPFERYDLYAQMGALINTKEMIKTIDSSGHVLVLRPDVTLPITKQIADRHTKLNEALRYFYVDEVFRADSEEHRESKTQAGVEYFGNQSSEADAEIIALAIHALDDLNVDFTIEVGHAGFFSAIGQALHLEVDALTELKKLIQAKNVAGLSHFLKQFTLDEALVNIVLDLPFLYGRPDFVFAKVEKLELTPLMKEKLKNLKEITQHLESYGIKDHIVIDLGLINHMDYYSDMIFQGFTKAVAKPVLMGGRYDNLAEQFYSQIPAIGFAFDVEFLFDSLTKSLHTADKINVITYDEAAKQDAFTLAKHLRKNYTPVTLYPEADYSIKHTERLIQFKAGKVYLNEENKRTEIKDLNELIQASQIKRSF